MEITRVLLETSAYSALFRGHQGVARVVRQAEEIYLTTVVLGELKSGFRFGKRTAENEALLEQFLGSPRVSVLDLDRETSDRYAEIVSSLRRAGKPIPTNDIWIASTAMQHGLRLVTTDAHYRRVAQVIVDCFEV